MIVYRDLLSGDEMISDSYKLLPVVDKDGNTVEGLMMVESKMVTKTDGDVDVGCGNAFGGGGEEEGVDSSVQQVNNIIDAFQYTETQIGGAADFKAWLKEYMQAVRAKLKDAGTPQEDIKAFMGRAQNIAVFLMKNFSDLQFYLGASFNADSMVFSLYPEGALTPNFYYIMDGLKSEKF